MVLYFKFTVLLELSAVEQENPRITKREMYFNSQHLVE